MGISAVDVMLDLQSQGYTLQLEDGKLFVTPIPNPATLELLRVHKPGILQLLATVDPPTEGADNAGAPEPTIAGAVVQGDMHVPPGPKRRLITPWKDLLPVKMQANEVILPEEREPLLSAWAAFRREHGRILADLGWDRQSLMDGLDPAKATTWDEMPFFPHLLKGGAQLLSATRILLKFKDRHFGILWRVQPGLWWEDQPFNSWCEAFGERAAIRQFDGGMDMAAAEMAAALDLAEMDWTDPLPIPVR